MSIVPDSLRKRGKARHLSTARAIEQWLDESSGRERRLDYAESALEWCRRLPKLADMLPATVWQRLLDHLVQSAAEAARETFPLPEAEGTSDSDLASSGLEADPLVHQLLAGELALTLASLFPEIRACRRLLPRARRTLSTGLADLLDGEGHLHASHFGWFRPLLACWTRCRTLGARWKRGCWSAEADARFRQFVRNALQFARRDGSQVFSEELPDREDAATLAAAVAMVGGEDHRAIASLVLSDNKRKHGRPTGIGLPTTAIYSEWAATAVLRPDWSRSAPRLTVLYPGMSCRVELACGKDVLWSGDWGCEVRIDGVPALPVSEWSDTCWVSDEDVDYLELEIELSEGLRVQRHILMARKDRFLLLADAVLGTRQGALDYRGTLPLGRSVTFRAACESNEGVLAGRKARAIVIPLALPEWIDNLPSPHQPSVGARRGAGGEGLARISYPARELGDSVPLLGTSSAGSELLPGHSLSQAVARDGEKRDPGDLQEQDKPISRSEALTLARYRRERGAFAEGALELRQSACGRSLFAPLVFDFDRRRFGQSLTWRRLTVAESLAIQPADVAVGYRVAKGGRQWLIYRSLTPSANRTLLGHNLSSETLVARFTRKGEVKPLIEIE